MSEQPSAIDVLARRLDQALPPGKSFIPPQTPDPLVNTAAEIAKLQVPVLSPEASARIRVQLLATYDQQYPTAAVRSSARVRQWVSPVLRWRLVASLLLVALLVGTAPAVGASLPGEILYPVKQFYETVELAAATSSSAKAAVHVNQAERRSEEALRLLERGNFDAELIVAALDGINAAALAENAVRTSPRLRGQLLQVETTLAFVLENAGSSGFGEPEELDRLTQLVSDLGDSSLLLPLPTLPPEETALSPVNTATEIILPTGTLNPSQIEASLTLAPTCDSPGRSCLSQGVPGGQSLPAATNTARPSNTHRPSHTPRPTNTHRPSHTPQPTNTPRPTNTHRPTSLPPIVPENPGNSGGQGEGNSGGNPNNGQGANGNPGGNPNNGQGSGGNPGENPNNGQGANGNPGGNPNNGQGNGGNSGNGQGGGNSS